MSAFRHRFPSPSALLTAALTGVALVVPAAAQSKRAIFPSDHVNVEGPQNTTTVPFSNGVTRMQLVYDRGDLTVPNNAGIKTVGFRQDADFPVTSQGYQLQLEVRIGKTTVAPSAVTSSFANNVTGTPATVFSKKVFSLPTMMAVNSGPSTTFVMVPLDAPFAYDASQNLAVEYLVYANSNSSQGFPYHFDVAGPLPTNQQIGAACTTSGGKTPTLTSSGGALGAFWSVALSNGPGTQQVGFLVSPAMQTLPLPGAPGCTALVDLSKAVVQAVTTTPSGSAGFGFTVPNSLFLDDKTLFTQIAIVDPFANALGVVTSNATATTFASPPRETLVYATGTTATNGAVAPAFGIVSAFDY